MSGFIDFIIEYPEVLASIIGIILGIVVYLVLRWILGRSMRRKVYLCIDHFIRNCHEQSFYAPTHNEYSECTIILMTSHFLMTFWDGLKKQTPSSVK